MTVAAILNGKGRDVLTAGPDATLAEICKLLDEHRIGALVILEKDGSVCGIASERDIVRQVSRQGNAALALPVSSCMTRKVVSCSEHDTIDHVMGKMTDGRFRHLPVLENGKLAGIISIGDIVKAKIQQAELEAEELKRYIAG